jgi:uncharacterized protein (TIRG00374 family)
MKKKLIVFGLVVLGISIFAGVLGNAGWTDIWAMLSQMTIGKFLVFLALTQVSYALFNLRWQIILKTHGHHIPFAKLWLYRATGYGISYITPTQVGGEPVRIYLLNENHGIRLREATASVLFDKLLEMSSFLVFVGSGIIVASFTNLVPDSSLYSVSLLIGGLVLVGIYIFKKLLDGEGFLTTLFRTLRLEKIPRLQKFEEKIHNTEKLIMDFLSHTEHRKTTLPLLAFISLLAWSFTIAEYYMLSQFLGIGLTGFQSFLVATIPLMAYLLPVPGGLGMLEGAQAGMFGLLGYASSAAFAVVVMVRVKEIFFSSIGFGYALTHGLTLFGKEKAEKEQQRHRSLRDQEEPSQKEVEDVIRVPEELTSEETV